MKLTIIILIIVAVALFLKLRPFSGQARKVGKRNALRNKTRARKSTPPEKTPYQAVSIEFGQNACLTVQAMADKFFLAKKVPVLPLPECTSATCHCEYIHHKGRRHAIRRLETILTTTAYEVTGKLERREKRGRRATD